MTDITRDITIVKGGKPSTVQITLSEDEWENTTDTALQALHGDQVVVPKPAPKPAPKPKAKKPA